MMIPLRSSLLLAIGISAAVIVVGCRRKKAAMPEPPLPPTEAPAAVATPPPLVTGSAPVQAVSSIASMDAAHTQEMTQTLNDFLGDYIKQHKRIPRDIAEMVSLKIITSVPVLPGGKKWVINQQTGKISAQ